MKLSLDTITIGANLRLRELLKLLPAAGFAAVEFRCEDDEKHGVEPEITPEERQRVRTLLESAGLEVSCLSTSQEFHFANPSKRRAAIARTKEFIDLAADLGCGRVRTFANQFPPGVPQEQVIQYVAESLRECAQYAEGKGVDVLLEMHGAFYYWEYCLAAVQAADHPNVAINYNCDRRDLVDGSVAFTFNKVKDYVRHVHMHTLDSKVFPYKELYGILKGMNYMNFLSLEVGESGGGEKRIIELYAALFHELMAQV